MTKEYFDLAVPASHDTYSMARYLAARDLVLTIDPPGVGKSDTPDDPYALSPEVVADVLAAAVSSASDELWGGTKAGASVPMATMGLGHSAGALLVAYEQARHGTFDALALLGFSASGLPGVLNDDEIRFAWRPQEFSEARIELTRSRFGEPLPDWTHTGASSGNDSGASSIDIDHALESASSRLLALVGMTAIMPGAVQPQLDEISNPVFAALGEEDLAGTLDVLPAQFPVCNDLTLFELKQAGHNHNVAPTRAQLWQRLLGWAPSVL
jgi:pimeloyl-ACP methyl ester carboxylesterase